MDGSYPGDIGGEHVAEHGRQVEGEEAGEGDEVLPRDEEAAVHPLDVCTVQSTATACPQ